MARVYILSGPTGSGKTTRLLQWSKKQDSVAGILSPVIHGERYFHDLSTGEQFTMEAGDDKETLNVGRYRFSLFAFSKAVRVMENALSSSSDWLVLDEAGPLEINGKGFYPVLELLVKSRRRGGIIIVVREQILSGFIQLLSLNDDEYTLLSTASPIFD
jgi:nucleoside-triphosphatase THEP1